MAWIIHPFPQATHTCYLHYGKAQLKKEARIIHPFPLATLTCYLTPCNEIVVTRQNISFVSSWWTLKESFQSQIEWSPYEQETKVSNLTFKHSEWNLKQDIVYQHQTGSVHSKQEFIGYKSKLCLFFLRKHDFECLNVNLTPPIFKDVVGVEDIWLSIMHGASSLEERYRIGKKQKSWRWQIYIKLTRSKEDESRKHPLKYFCLKFDEK